MHLVEEHHCLRATVTVVKCTPLEKPKVSIGIPFNHLNQSLIARQRKSRLESWYLPKISPVLVEKSTVSILVASNAMIIFIIVKMSYY